MGRADRAAGGASRAIGLATCNSLTTSKTRMVRIQNSTIEQPSNAVEPHSRAVEKLSSAVVIQKSAIREQWHSVAYENAS